MKRFFCSKTTTGGSYLARISPFKSGSSIFQNLKFAKQTIPSLFNLKISSSIEAQMKSVFDYLISPDEFPSFAILCKNVESGLALKLMNLKNHVKTSGGSITTYTMNVDKSQKNASLKLTPLSFWEERGLYLDRIFNEKKEHYEFIRSKQQIISKLTTKPNIDHEQRWKSSELFEYPEMSYGLRERMEEQTLFFKFEAVDKECMLVELSGDLRLSLETCEGVEEMQSKHLLRFEKIGLSEQSAFVLVDIDDFMKSKNQSFYQDFRIEETLPEYPKD